MLMLEVCHPAYPPNAFSVEVMRMSSILRARVLSRPDFLFSRDRLNVATSRAKCVAYLLCTEDAAREIFARGRHRRGSVVLPRR